MTTLDRLFKKDCSRDRRKAGRSATRHGSAAKSFIGKRRGTPFAKLLDASPGFVAAAIVSGGNSGERDGQLLDDLRKLVERKRRELNSQEAGQRETGSARPGRKETE